MVDLGLTDSLGASAQQQVQPSPFSGVGNFLAHPGVQALLATYLGMISTPRRLGFGAALGQGGLMGLQAYNQGLGSQERAAALGLEQQRLQQEVEQGKQRQQAISQLPADIQPLLALDPSAAGTIVQQKMAGQNNQAVLGQLGSVYQADPEALALIQAYSKSSKPIEPGEVIKAIQGVKSGALDLQKTLALIRKDNLEGQLAQGRINMLPLDAAQKQAQISAEQASAAASAGSAALDPLRGQLLQAQTKKALEGPVPSEQVEYGITDPTVTSRTRGQTPDPGMTFLRPESAKSTSPLEVQKEAEKEAQTRYGELPMTSKLLYGLHGDKAAVMDTLRQQRKSALSGSLPSHAHTGEGLPGGSRPNGDGTWTLPDGSTVRPKGVKTALVGGD